MVDRVLTEEISASGTAVETEKIEEKSLCSGILFRFQATESRTMIETRIPILMVLCSMERRLKSLTTEI
ncbi:MAG: hypothetical protein JW913_00905 [Chitinispirillaceae bacterium]|nr:hypothetical protein [Chitinispirillaceae bacterium]